MTPKQHKKFLFWPQFAYFAFGAIHYGSQAWQDLHLNHYSGLQLSEVHFDPPNPRYLGGNCITPTRKVL